MEIRKSLKIILTLIGMLSIPIFYIDAYESKTTHPALTQEVIKLFEHHYSQHKFTEGEKKLLEQGSTNEDNPLYRCFFHFYDPIYETGLKGNLSAKQWGKSTKIQAIFDFKYMSFLANISQDFFGSETDFTFNRAVFEYVHGNKLRGLESLGHVLHLIEDMDVPAHTRNDGHPLGDSFEVYADQWTKDRVDIASGLITDDQQPIIYDNLGDYFYNLALFSNQNFFSEDTIFDEKYSGPVVNYKKVENINGDLLVFGYKSEKLGKLIEIDKKRNKKTGEIDVIYLINDENDLVFKDYWNTLSKQAVLYGAGVVKLFFDKVEEEKRTGVLYKKNQSWYKKIIRNIGYGINNIIDFISEVIGRFKKTLAEINPQDMVAEVGDWEAEVGGESPQLPPPNQPIVTEPKPEDPNSPELQRLALILREAEKMVARLEKRINDLEGQNVGGSKEELIIVAPVVVKKIENKIVVGYGGGGGGAAATPTLVSPVPILVASPTVTTTTTTTPIITATTTPVIISVITTATTTPTVVLATTTVPILINPPIITSPSDFSQFATTTIDFSGTASSTQIISTDFSIATTTVNQNNNWDLTLAGFMQGTTTIQFFASDGQAISSSTLISINVDIATSTFVTIATTTPSVDLDIFVEINQCLDAVPSDSCLIANPSFDIFWSTTTSDEELSHFNVEKNGVFSTTVATTTQIIDLDDGDTYIFSIATVDINNNTSATSTKMITVNTMPVVINEIAWRGTSVSTDKDEWIELYNRSNVDIDLNDWMLYSQDGSPNISLATTSPNIISAGGYYLIERTDDDTVSDISADLIASFGTGLGNTSGEHLILAYKKSGQATTTVDEAPFADGWLIQDGYRTLERRNPAQLGTDTNNWALVSNDPNSWNGFDANGGVIKGTPKQENSNNSMIDTIAPDSPSLEILQCDNSMSENSCLIATTTLDIIWATTTPCVDFSHFNIDDNGTFSTTMATTTQIINLNDGDIYTFSVATVDTSGNVSVATTKTIIINQTPVVINEIAWAGTDASIYDEWIELYNRSDKDIDLSDWILYSEDSLLDLSFSEASDKIIEANSYYLIESQDDNTISDILADCVFAFNEDEDSDGLSNNGEHLILAYKKSGQATTTVDEVFFAQDEGSWPDRSNICSHGRCRTLEKYDKNLPGNNRDNWGLSIGQYILNGYDIDGTVIRGTPRAKNSLSYKIAKGNHLTQDKTLVAENSPYFIGSDGLTVDAGVTLTLGPGVVVKTVKRYGDAQIVVNGSIQSNGGEYGDQVIFTIFSDDIGEDTNGDGDCISGTTCPGEINNYWSQLVFDSSEASSFDNTLFRFGGSRTYTKYPASMVVVKNSNVDFKNVAFELSYTTGLHMVSSTSIIDHCYFKNTKKRDSYISKTYYGLYVMGGDIEVKNSFFENNQIGLGLFDTVGAVVDSNVFRNYDDVNTRYADFPLILRGSTDFVLKNNSGEDNYKNAISLSGYVARSGSNTTLVKNPLPYLLENNLNTVANSTLTIGPGVVIKFNDNCVNCGVLVIGGQFFVNGGEGNNEKVIFTSAYDDSDGTDMYNDGPTDGKVTKNQKIVLTGTTPIIKNAEFRYLKEALSFVNCDPVDINLENVLFRDNVWSIQADTKNVQVSLADNLTFASSTSQSMNFYVGDALQTAKDNGANIIW